MNKEPKNHVGGTSSTEHGLTIIRRSANKVGRTFNKQLARIKELMFGKK